MSGTPKRWGRERRTPSDLAMTGYWHPHVQRVVKRWRDKIGEQWCQHYAAPCFYTVWSDVQAAVHVDLATYGHRDYVLEVLGAMARIERERDKPAIWLLEACNGGGIDYLKSKPIRPRLWTYEELQALIQQRSGRKFSVSVLEKSAERLGLKLPDKND